jgi:hypothetical protein
VVNRVEGHGLKKVVMTKFFDTFEELLSLCKRKKRTLERKGRGKKKETTSSVNATKPSALKSVIAFERNAVAEIYEAPWKDIEALKQQYAALPPQDVDRTKLLKKLRAAITAQWSSKTQVLKQTRHRVIRGGPNSKLQEDLTLTQNELGKIKSEEDYLVYITQKEKSIAIFPPGKFVTGGRTFTSFVAFLREDKTDSYTHAKAILALHDSAGITKRTKDLSVGDDRGKRRKFESKSSGENQFEVIAEGD